ncbi:hypothetical protein [Pseudomonas purpurea]|uniref:hypothetical protein n=1 Tax=Pseudomonas purpurea TaxID=3136737 RepID=UPI0032635A82
MSNQAPQCQLTSSTDCPIGHGAASTRGALDPQFEYGILPLEGGFTVNGKTFASNEQAYL